MRCLAAAAILVFWACPALAADESAGLLWPSVNLLLLIGVLVYFSRKPIQNFFATRRRAIQGELNGAADELSEAEASYNKWQQRLIGLENELDEIRATSRERAESERERILAEAHVSADRIRRDATDAVDQELRRAREALREEVTQLAIELAGERLQRVVTDADRDRLLVEFIEQVESAPAFDAAAPEEGS